MSNVQVQVHLRLHLDLVIEVREVQEVRGVVVANTLIAEGRLTCPTFNTLHW